MADLTPVDGILMVHLFEDADDKWFPLELQAGGGIIHAQFDAIADYTYGTTIDIDDSLLLFPINYGNEFQP